MVTASQRVDRALHRLLAVEGAMFSPRKLSGPFFGIERARSTSDHERRRLFFPQL
jgi:hypothetical protein